MMVESAVGDEKDVAARDLAVHDPCHVDARLANQVTTELDDQRARGELGSCSPRQALEVRADGAEIKPLLACEVWNAEAAAEVQESHGRRRVLGQPKCELV